MPISTTKVDFDFGVKSILKGFLNEFIENKGFQGRTPFYLNDCGNKTQKCSESKFQVRSIFLEEVSTSFSEKNLIFEIVAEISE